MDIPLPATFEKLIDEKVRSGLYESPAEVVRESLRLLQDRDAMREAQLSALRAQVAVGMEQFERGETRPADMEEIKRKARRQQPHQRSA